MAHPYIDIAVLDRVRDRLSAGDAVLVLTPALDSVLLANGAGARLLGFASPLDLTGSDPELGAAARRQIEALDLERGGTVNLALRLTSGLSSRVEMVRVEAARLPDGGAATLISAAASGSVAEAIAGLADGDSHAAVIDADGDVLAASGEFRSLGLSADDLAAIAREAGGERDRIVKRRIAARGRAYPAGAGRISDKPARHILLVVEDRSLATPEPASGMEASATFGKRGQSPQSDVPQHDRWYFHGDRYAGLSTASGAVKAARTGSDEKNVSATQPPANRTRNEPHPAEPMGKADPHSAPVRFTWKIDAAGAFRSVSSEFAAAVGANAADIEGRTFRDVTQAFAMDPSGEIASLLERHDTWSGRSLLWPLEGTDLRVPVDLAALPIYDRDRRFDGFRGFGIVRLADAVIDPEAIGLALAPAASLPEPTDSAQKQETHRAEAEEPRTGEAREDPWQGETPALVMQGRPELPSTDKVIRLEERRQPRDGAEAAAGGQLSPVERSAFREIAERLRREGLIVSHDAHVADEDLAAMAAVEDGLPGGPSELVEQPASVSEEPLAAHDGDAILDDAAAPDADELADVEQGQPFDLEATQTPTADGAGEDGLAAGALADDGQTGTGARDTAGFDYPDGDGGDVADLFRLDEPRGEEPVPTEPRHEAEGDIAATAEEPLDEAPILARLPVPVLIHNGQDLLFANQAFLDLTGYASLPALREAGGLERLFAQADPGTEADSEANSLLRTAYDKDVPVRAHLHSVPWHGGHALLLSIRPLDGRPAPAADVSTLRREVDELSSVLETATDGVVFINPDGTIRNITQSAEALFGFDPAEVNGKPFALLFATESQKAVNDYLANLSGNGVASLLNDGREVIGREAHGRFIPLFMTIGNLAGGANGHCAVLRDITQWKRAEEELSAAKRAAEHASSQKSEFLARVSHEIRTPLNAIIGFSDLMTEERFGPVGNQRYLDYLRDINRSGRHVLDLVNDLLDISKIEAGQQEMDFEAVRLNETLAEAVSIMQPQANKNRVIIRSSFASDLPDVVADLRSVKQIALNLLSNAVRYTGAGGQVIISTAYELTGGVTIRVRDNGIGMTAQEIEQAMKPFKQINALNRSRGEGTGLGLPLTKAMVEANRANFSISSTPGQGTLAEITFPSTRVLAD